MLIFKAIYPKGVNAITVVSVSVVSLALAGLTGYFIGTPDTPVVDVAPVKVETVAPMNDDMTIHEFNLLMEPIK